MLYHFDEATGKLTGFTKLPHYTGSAWQGGPAWPDATLGWVQLTAAGGHAGNDLAHAAVRRWTAPRAMSIDVKSKLLHETPAGDGVRGFLLHRRSGKLASATVHNSSADLSTAGLTMEAGDTLDFCVDIGGSLNNDQFTWQIEITSAGNPAIVWNSASDFRNQGQSRTDPWTLLAQVLLSSNEFMFVD